jgi:hypothetical protein
MSPDKVYVRDAPQQGLKPNSLLIFYGPTNLSRRAVEVVP